MNLLIDPPPESVKIAGTEWPIRWDYRYWVMYEMLMLDSEIAAEEKFRRALDLCFAEIPDDLSAAQEAMIDFYRCGKSDKTKSSDFGSGATGIAYSFEHDGAYIYAAFMQDYGIDLTEATLHWWKFRALFNAISTKTLFGKIMAWRMMEIDEKTPAAEKKRLLALKEQYAIPRPRKNSEVTDGVIQLLMGSGDFGELL